MPGGTRIKDNDFSAVIAKARAVRRRCRRDVQATIHGRLPPAPCCWTPPATIVEAVKAGKISRFFVIGGCDGAEPGRNYFSDYAASTPARLVHPDARLRQVPHPRLRLRHRTWACPACWTWASATTPTARSRWPLALAKAFDCGVNDLPLTLVISWFEQKAVAVLLTLLSLGVKGITLGPNPPAFITPNVFKILQEKFDLRLTGEAKADLAAAMG